MRINESEAGEKATPNEHCAQTIPVTGWNSFRIDESVYSGSADTGSNFRISAQSISI